LGHITRSGIVLLCASCEQYIEDVTLEGVELLLSQIPSPNDLPENVQRSLSRKVKLDKHELKPIHMAGDGWKDLLRLYTKDDLAHTHSPRYGNIRDLFKNYLGITTNVADSWSIGINGLDAFVEMRNHIAHKGRASGRYIKYHQFETSYEEMITWAVETDNFLSDELSGLLPNGRPWRRTYKR